MKTNKRYATAVLGSLLTAAILTGVALAGNPHGTPPGQAKKQSSGSASASASTAAGVKSSSTTNTSKNTAAPAGSTKTKLYGNGKTAGQIAMKNGASSDTMLKGPGNSQPHKAVLCPGSKHSVDVHALKAHGGKSCSGGTTGTTGSTNTSTSTSTSTSVTTKGNGVSAVAKAHGHTSSKGAFTPPSSTGSVRGAQHSQSVSNRARPAHAVLGTANFTG